uniref:TIP41-like protein n=1 Tax=Phallusia mammillata TaxID=59560 RepID=A0A6F9DVD0_9ASCI|nr:TIP41-like protein [Phallusia mammillata]
MTNRVATPFGEKKEPFVYGPWTFVSNKTHILNSGEIENLCEELDLPQLPEMTFGHNKFTIKNSEGFSFEFNTIDALRLVDNKHDLMKVAGAKEWIESRKNNDINAETVKPFDWTYTTKYNGTIIDNEEKLKISETTDRIDIERLKTREKILFFEEMMLFEDELADNGSAQLTVKIRVMPSCFFLLLRFFLRVDGVLSRILDTRWYHEFGKNHIIREYTEKEKSFNEMRGVSPAMLTDVNYMDRILKLTTQRIEKIEFPSQATPANGAGADTVLTSSGETCRSETTASGSSDIS